MRLARDRMGWQSRAGVGRLAGGAFAVTTLLMLLGGTVGPGPTPGQGLTLMGGKHLHKGVQTAVTPPSATTPTLASSPTPPPTPTATPAPTPTPTPTATATPTPTPTAPNPYGFTSWSWQTSITTSGVKWFRDQRDWSSIETSAGVYNWSGLDADVAAANAAGVKITFPITNAPSFRLTQVCNGVNLFPGPNEMSTFAGIMAARYNGNDGHGYVDSFEIGNEEWDNYWGGSWSATLPCRTANWYGPVLKAGYQAIKAQSPNALVGMFGLWWLDTTHFHDYMTWLYANGYGGYMDFANFHYYPGGDPSITNGSVPSYPLAWQTIRGVQTSYGDGAKPVWCTEFGWAVSSVAQSGPIVTTAQQSQYIQYVLDNSRTSGVIQHAFIYTILDNSYDGMNIYRPTGPLPSYTMLEGYIAQYPSW